MIYSGFPSETRSSPSRPQKLPSTASLSHSREQISRSISSSMLVSMSSPNQQTTRLEKSLLGSDTGWETSATDAGALHLHGPEMGGHALGIPQR